MRPTVERDILGELLDAVNMLTQPNVSVIKQEKGDVTTLTRVELPSYLSLLRNAIGSTVGQRAPGGALASQRAIIDGNALELYESISKTILTRYRGITASAPFSNPEQNLRQIYLAYADLYRKGQIHRDSIVEDVIMLEGWIAAIDDKLNPPTTFDVPKPCPNCGKTWVSRGGDSMQAVQVQYREAPDKSLAATKAICRGCDSVWRGTNELRKLVWEIDQKDEKRG